LRGPGSVPPCPGRRGCGTGSPVCAPAAVAAANNPPPAVAVNNVRRVNSSMAFTPVRFPGFGQRSLPETGGANRNPSVLSGSLSACAATVGNICPHQLLPTAATLTRRTTSLHPTQVSLSPYVGVRNRHSNWRSKGKRYRVMIRADDFACQSGQRMFRRRGRP